MGNCLGVGCDTVVLFVRHIDESGANNFEDAFRKSHGFIGRSVSDQNLWKESAMGCLNGVRCRLTNG